jgi:hypothetical protein
VPQEFADHAPPDKFRMCTNLSFSYTTTNYPKILPQSIMAVSKTTPPFLSPFHICTTHTNNLVYSSSIKFSFTRYLALSYSTYLVFQQNLPCWLQVHLTHEFRMWLSAPHDSNLDSLSGKQHVSYLSNTDSSTYELNM